MCKAKNIKILAKLLIGLIILFAANTLQAQQIDFTIVNYGIEDGLSQGTVNCIYQDSRGFIWIGTQDGLNKFDGYKFRSFRHEPLDTNSISSNYIRAICEDKDGNIWVATQNGLGKYTYKTGYFKTYQNNPLNPKSVASSDIQTITVTNDGILWVKTEKMLDKFDVNGNSFEHHEFFFDDFNFASEYNYFAIFEDSQAKLWLGTKEGLMMFDRETEQFERYTTQEGNPLTISNNEIRTIFEDKDKNLWIGTQFGLNQFNKRNRTFTRYYVDEKRTPALNIITDLCEDQHGNFWIATDVGIKLLDRKTKAIVTFECKSPLAEVISTKKVTALMLDQMKILWVCTWGGAYKMDSKQKKFKLFQKYVNGKTDFPENKVYSIFQDETGKLWLGSKYSGLQIYDPKTGAITTYNTKTPANKLPTDNVGKIYQLKNGNIWLGTNNGIFAYDKQTGKFNEIRAHNSGVLKNNRIFSMLQDSYGIIWIATQNKLISLKNDTFNIYKSIDSIPTSLSSKEVYCLLEDSKRDLWIGTVNGLNRYNRAKDNFIRYDNEPNKKRGLSNKSVLSMYEDKMGVLWVGTETGLNYYNPKTEKFTFFTQKDGFVSDYIYGILEDNKDNLWVSTNHGIAKFDRISKLILNYDLDDGLQGYEYNLGVAYKNKAGELFFGGTNGVNFFNPDSIFNNDNVPKVVITRLEIRSKKSKKELLVEDGQEIVLPYNQNSFTIEFAILDYTYPTKNQFKCILDGLENEWYEIGNQHYATYTQVPEGDYIFKVKGANSDRVWNNEPTTIRITIKPPFWRTKLAYIIYGIASILAIYFTILYITRNVRKENQILQLKQIAADEIERQKEELAIKNLNITDSIHYAKRIIEAMMPSDKLVKRLLPQSFVLYLPKDIVSGDFYWIAEKRNKIFVAAVDCTGHGVPGAFMSIIGFDLLRNITNEENIVAPDEILNRLNTEVANTFRREIDEDTVRDGMDISFCVIDKEKEILEFAGAINPMYLIRNDNIIEINADRFSVGIVDEEHKRSFCKQVVPLEKEDIIYLFSDGYSDQFGGPQQKKFKYRKFKHLLLNIHKQPIEVQKDLLYTSFLNWRGDLEQVDDILVIGIKPLV